MIYYPLHGNPLCVNNIKNIAPVFFESEICIILGSVIPLCFDCVFGFSASEEERGQPKTAYCHESVYNSRKNIALTAEYPSDYIKSEKSDRAPVKSTDDTKEQSYSVKYHFFHPPR